MSEEKTSVLSNAALLEQWPHDMDLLHEVRKRTGDTIMLGFSRSKDSIAAWLMLRDSGLFKKIIPVHLYTIPHMKFVDESIKYFEDVFHTHIYQIPHPSFYRMMDSNMFTPPGRIWANYDFWSDMQCTYEEQNTWFKETIGLPQATLQANGVRAMDTMVRRMGIHRHGPFSKDNVKVIWNWSTKQVLQIIKDNNIQLPVDYEMFGRSLDGIGYQYMKPIKERFPNDYEKALQWFPLIELEMFRFEQMEECSDDLIIKNGRVYVNYEKFKKEAKENG